MSVDLVREDIVDKASRELDNPLIESRIILRGNLVGTYSSTSFRDVIDTTSNVCRDKLCFARIHIEKPFEGVLAIYVLNGKVLGAVLKFDNQVLYGVNALKNDVVAKIAKARIVIYEFKPDMLADIAKSLTQYMELLRSVEVAERREPERAVEKLAPGPRAVAAPSLRELRGELMKFLSDLGFELIDLTLAEGEKLVAVDIICDKSKPLYNPEEVSLPLLRRLLTSVSINKDVRVSVHHKKTFSRTYEISKKDLWVLLGLIPELILVKYRGGLRIDGLKYREGRNSLDISIVLRRETLYSTVSVQDLAKEIYEELRKHWGGRITVRVRIGRFGLEGRAP